MPNIDVFARSHSVPTSMEIAARDIKLGKGLTHYSDSTAQVVSAVFGELKVDGETPQEHRQRWRSFRGGEFTCASFYGRA